MCKTKFIENEINSIGTKQLVLLVPTFIVL